MGAGALDPSPPALINGRRNGGDPSANTSSTSARSRSLGVTLFDTGVGSFLVT